MKKAVDLKKIVVIPTYNEKENIEKLTNLILELDCDFNVCVVDDNSPDGTAQIVENLQKTHNKAKNIHLLKRPGKLGLGTAYKTGINYGLANNFELIFTMDADFSHHPKYLPDFLKKLDEYDIIIGSRYVPGGGTVNWGLHRKILSRCANLFAKIMLNIKSNDNTAGYRGYHRKVFEKINLDIIQSNGYSFLVEMIYYCHKNGFSVGETPIVFVDREKGKSKISKNEIYKAIKTILRLKFA
ncbi:MAG TPA: polyprenol monophosphomannose synthase [bacterium]|nr:polyprenol monophosphomannose synthase [bacterium]HPP88212.1 polyprenol monophosphomannose synthase [bacterium]